MSIKWLTFHGCKWILGIISLILAMHIKHPLTFKIRGIETQLQIVILIILTGFILYQIIREQKSTRKIVDVVGVTVLVLTSLMIFSNRSSEFFLQKQKVLNANKSQLHRLGKHFIVGYTNFEDIRELVKRGAIGGVYITTRNTKEKSYNEIKVEIGQLQKIQRQNQLPPLFITTDQEGGITSRLSPPLTALPPLSILVDEHTRHSELLKQTRLHAGFQARDMYQLGINLNLSPTVDLKVKDTVQRVTFKAISPDEQIVTSVGLEYCKSLETYGVIPTLKHFPGLGRVKEDTRNRTGLLNDSIQELQENDWKPFRIIAKETNAFIMLGHVKLNQLDKVYPASFSKKIVQTIIRKKWHYTGVLITDDLNMAPAFNNKIGIGNVTIKALNAGVDLLLFSYDGDQYYRAMATLITAEKERKLDYGMLAKSARRLKESIQNILTKRMVIIKSKIVDHIIL